MLKTGKAAIRLVSGVLAVFVLVLQYQLWFGPSSISALKRLEQSLRAQRDENKALEARNQMLEVEILDLKNGLEAVEERARSELGMIADQETFYLIID